MILPNRCEVITQIDSFKTLSEDSVVTIVLNQEIKPVVFVARSIISKNSPFGKMINTTLENETIKNAHIQTVPLSNCNIFNIEVNDTK